LLSEQRRLLEAARRALNGISQPTLIVHSREDRCAGLDNAGYLQRHLRGLVDMVILGGNHHTASLSRQPDFIVEKATAFIASVAKRPRLQVQGVKPAPQLATVLPRAA
jgi:pimeloyl-ACP methyl ester carboxylesterase